MAEAELPIRGEYAVVAVRQACRRRARDLGFGSADQTRLATAVSEVVRNVIQYAGEGVCRITEESSPEEICLAVVIEDHGPGIPDLGRALEGGFGTGEGLGAGLPGARRLVHGFTITSEPGCTRVTLRMRRRRS